MFLQESLFFILYTLFMYQGKENRLEKKTYIIHYIEM